MLPPDAAELLLAASHDAMLMLVSRTTGDVDVDALLAARVKLGTKGLSATVNAALREVARRRALAGFDVLHDIDGTPAEVESNRQDRTGDAERRV